MRLPPLECLTWRQRNQLLSKSFIVYTDLILLNLAVRHYPIFLIPGTPLRSLEENVARIKFLRFHIQYLTYSINILPVVSLSCIHFSCVKAKKVSFGTSLLPLIYGGAQPSSIFLSLSTNPTKRPKSVCLLKHSDVPALCRTSNNRRRVLKHSVYFFDQPTYMGSSQ